MATPAKLTPKNQADGEWRPAFLAHLGKTANVRASAIVAGITRQGAYKARDADPAFASAWDDAIDDAVDLLEEEARKRGMETSDTLLIFLLKAHRPDKYRERVQMQHADADGKRLPLGAVEEFVKDALGNRA